MTTIGVAIGVEATSLTIATFTFPIPMPYRRAIEAVTTDPDMRAEFVHHTQGGFVRHTLPVVTPHVMQAAIALSTTPAPAHITRLPPAKLPMQGTSKNQPFQSPTKYLGAKTAIRQGIGRLNSLETRSTIRRRPGATRSTTSHRSIQGTIRCAAMAIKAMSSAVAAIMPSGATGLADRRKSSVTEVVPFTEEAVGSEAVEEAFTAVVAALEGVVVAGE